MKGPSFSVIVVSYNAGDKLTETVKSILRQTCGDFEIIVKDADSSDGSVERLPQDHRIRLIRGKDGGIYEAMNIALSHATGDWIYFLNCGDLLHDETVLEKVLAGAAGVVPPAILYGDVVLMTTGQRAAANPDMSHFAMFRRLPCHQACFYSKDLFEEGFRTQYRVRADYEHFLRCVIRLGAAVKALPVLVADYEGGGFSESEKGKKLSSGEHDTITKEYFTKTENFLFRAYLVLTLQPLRARLASGKHTAALYEGLRSRIYDHRKRNRT